MRRGGAGPVGGLLGGKDPTGRFVFLLISKVEHVVVAGRGVVREDRGQRIEVEDAEVIDTAADPLTISAALASFAAVGVVFGNGALHEVERRHDIERPAFVVNATAQADAAVAPDGTGATDSPVVVQRASRDGHG